MRPKKNAEVSLCVSRKIAMPDEINPHGTLFGGVMMSWIDKVGYMCAQNYAEWKKTVTANIDQIKFHQPVYSGDHVILRSYVASVGKSSMEIDVHVFKQDPVLKNNVPVADAHMTFVAVNDDGKGKIVPELILETHEDLVRYQRAQIRIKMRGELKKELEELHLKSETIITKNTSNIENEL
jgi:acyl-CoA hydrolase